MSRKLVGVVTLIQAHRVFRSSALPAEFEHGTLPSFTHGLNHWFFSIVRDKKFRSTRAEFGHCARGLENEQESNVH